MSSTQFLSATGAGNIGGINFENFEAKATEESGFLGTRFGATSNAKEVTVLNLAATQIKELFDKNAELLKQNKELEEQLQDINARSSKKPAAEPAATAEPAAPATVAPAAEPAAAPAIAEVPANAEPAAPATAAPAAEPADSQENAAPATDANAAPAAATEERTWVSAILNFPLDVLNKIWEVFTGALGLVLSGLNLATCRIFEGAAPAPAPANANSNDGGDAPAANGANQPAAPAPAAPAASTPPAPTTSEPQEPKAANQ